MNESDAIEIFKKKNKKNGVFYKLHGGRYQSSLPDIIWLNAGDAWFLEFKIIDGMKLPWKKMRLNQHLRMLEMAKHYPRIAYVVYSKETGSFYAVDPEEVKEDKTLDIIEDMKLEV